MIDDGRRQTGKILRNGSHPIGARAINNDYGWIRILGPGCGVQAVFKLWRKMLDLAPVERSDIEVPNKFPVRSIQEHTQRQRGGETVAVRLQMRHEIIGLVSGKEVGDFLGDRGMQGSHGVQRFLEDEPGLVYVKPVCNSRGLRETSP